MKNFVDYYELLQIHPSADIEIIEVAYKRLAKKYHPDVNPSSDAEEVMKKLNQAYAVLKNPISREKYHREWETHTGVSARKNTYKDSSSDTSSETISRTAYKDFKDELRETKGSGEKKTSGEKSNANWKQSERDLRNKLLIRLLLRIIARSIDIFLAMIGVNILSQGILHGMFSKINSSNLYSTIFFALAGLILMIFEIMSIFILGTTPGKWVMSISVRDPRGKKLTLMESIKRGSIIYSLGMGLYIIPALAVTVCYLFINFKKPEYIPFWDRKAKAAVSHKKVELSRILICIGVCGFLAKYF